MMDQTRLIRAAFWAAVAVSYVAAVMPADDAPDPTGWDKANHMLAFLTMAVLAVPAFPKARPWALALWLSAFGAFIELSQMVPMLHRDAQIGDWLADTLATGVGITAAWLWRRRSG